VTGSSIDLERFINKKAAGGKSQKEERIEIPLVLENVLRYCLKDASERMEKGEQVVPFTALAVGETLFMEEHPGDDVSECFHSARKTVEGARGALAYGFCYDGFIEVGNNKEMHDCLIAEGGCPGEPYGHAIGITYSLDSEGKAKFADEPIYVGNSLNYMLSLDPLEGDEEDGAAVEPQAE
jgi:hypothetical protein